MTARRCCGVLALLVLGATAPAQEAFTADWDSLASRNPVPEWFRDAKFGIYFHWGVYSVPAFGSEWYPRNMHLLGRRENQHHLAKYGSPVALGYPDFVPQFRAEKFDADAWAELFARAGARFAGPVAEHHDGFAMWDSDVTPWNAADRGPKRDLTGELARAIRARGMRFCTSFHHARNNLWEISPGKWTGHYSGVHDNYPQLLEDDERAILYGYLPREQFLALWKAKLLEVVDRYQPDLMWFDSWLHEIPETTRLEYLAHYFNRAREWGKEVVVTFKQQDLPREVGIDDYEKGRAGELTDFVWLTDDTISKGSWCWTEDLTIKSTAEVLHVFIDIVSKNGQLLLNLSPKADGTIPDDQQEVLREIGDWLAVNGMAIYETRPWLTFGEGPTRLAKGGHFVRKVDYGAADLRYTRSKDGSTVYAIALGWPGETLRPQKLKVRPAAGAAVRLLGHDGPLAYRVDDAGRLEVTLPDLAPDRRPCRFAYAFALTGFTTELQPVSRFDDADARKLSADHATLEGSRIGTETVDGRTNVGFWDDASESVHWLVHLPGKGRWAVRVECAAVDQGQTLELEILGQKLTARPERTGSWRRAAWLDFGEISVAEPGVHHLVLRCGDASTWRPVNVFQVQLGPPVQR